MIAALRTRRGRHGRRSRTHWPARLPGKESVTEAAGTGPHRPLRPGGTRPSVASRRGSEAPASPAAARGRPPGAASPGATPRLAPALDPACAAEHAA